MSPTILILLLFILNSNGSPTQSRSLEEVGEFFEGDLNLDPQQLRNIFTNAQAGLLDTRRRWLKNPQTGFVTVPFITRRDAPYLQAQHNIIRMAMNEIERNSCIRFVPRRDNQVDYVEIFAGSGCWSFVGRNGGMQQISLAHSNSGTCVTNGVVVHELLHALGLYHMQSSSNRDEFVRINLENVLSGYEHNFLRYDSNTVGLFSTVYDYDSIMHYNRNAFSRNGRDTITAMNSANTSRIGQRNHLSSGDIMRLRNMYNC